ncbi:MAG: efflux RND transporter periplasmic adaptor subunit [Planctomycetales bacterium]|nr:efflux RND transporter periplasmic adaptor subunit [Planctomycetales bacterium]
MHNAIRNYVICIFLCAALTQPLRGFESVPLLEPVDMLPGILLPVQLATLGSPLDGVIREYHVTAGVEIASGDLIATLDNRVTVAAMLVAKQAIDNNSELRLAEAQLAHTQRHLARVKQAFSQSAASEVELDAASYAHEQARLALLKTEEQRKQLQAQYSLAVARVAEHEIRSPFAGQVVRLLSRVGESRNRADQIAVVANVSRLQVDLQIPVRFYGLLQTGQQHTLRLAAPIHKDVQATVDFVEPQIDSATQTFRVRFVVDNHDQQLPFGIACHWVDTRQPLAHASK